jgi:hypothetical protein
MCGLCGLLGAESGWSSSIGSTLPARQERFQRIAQANRILSLFRLRLDDFQGVSYLLTGPTGRGEIVPDFGQLWQLAESFTNRPIDPLDPELLAWLDSIPP